MRLSKIRSFSIELPLATGEYRMSRGRELTRITTTVVEATAEDGTTGFGEACTLGTNYIEGFAGSTQAALHELAPMLLGVDVLEPTTLRTRMDAGMRGHQPAKAALDAACLDLRGKLLEMPAYKLLGGGLTPRYRVFHPLTLAEPGVMGEEAERTKELGYRSWQLKLGDDPLEDAARVHAVAGALDGAAEFVTSDANRGWSMADAMRFITATDGIDTYVEQPCPTLRELAEIRRRCPRPIVADEAVRDVGELLDCIARGAADAINLKPARVGGLTRGALLRDLAQEAGLKVMIDEPMGSQIAMAGVAHLAISCSENWLLAASHTTSIHVLESPGISGGPVLEDGFGRVSDEPGLGVHVDVAFLGNPVFTATWDGSSPATAVDCHND